MRLLPHVYQADFGYSVLFACALVALVAAFGLWQEWREREELKRARHVAFLTECALTVALWRNAHPAEPDSWVSDPVCRAGFEDAQ